MDERVAVRSAAEHPGGDDIVFLPTDQSVNDQADVLGFVLAVGIAQDEVRYPRDRANSRADWSARA